jgi:dynein heavy chain
MARSLRTIVELRNPLVKDRHWKMLMKATGISIPSVDNLKLEELLQLKLHEYEEDVHMIVDRAVREANTEKAIRNLESAWQTMAFTFETHETSKCPILSSLEPLLETLEDNQVILQNLLSSKYVGHFLPDIHAWQNKLASIDAFSNTWQSVQRTWLHLEKIFTESDDIRTQLPEDSQRFDNINTEWKSLMHRVSKTSEVIGIALDNALLFQLESFQADLAKCEKALLDYLEKKRQRFPRFYFVSSQDLLDILANGNKPHIVAVHLQKLFDNIANLKFGAPLELQVGEAVGMYSSEGEYVRFGTPLRCSGPVESWLNDLLEKMKSTLVYELEHAVKTYDENSREAWMIDHCAQMSLVASQIWWTNEVNAAFDRIEEGMENAMKDYYRKQVKQLTALISLIQGDLSDLDRRKIMTIW